MFSEYNKILTRLPGSPKYLSPKDAVLRSWGWTARPVLYSSRGRRPIGYGNKVHRGKDTLEMMAGGDAQDSHSGAPAPIQGEMMRTWTRLPGSGTWVEWWNLVCVLKAKATGLHNRLDVGSERKKLERHPSLTMYQSLELERLEG